MTTAEQQSVLGGESAEELTMGAQDQIEETDDEVIETDDTTEETPPVTPAPPAAPQARVLSIPTSAMSKIKATERERGRKEAQDAQNAQARDLGFVDFEDMKTHAQRARAAQPPVQRPNEVTPPPAPPARTAPTASPEHEQTLARLLDERKVVNKNLAREEKKRQQLERQLEAQEAESALRIAAIRAGVEDVDYALELCRRDMEDKTEAELVEFDENSFFAIGLRETHPYLYGVVDVPATTGNAGANAAPPPGTTQVQPEQPGNGAIDAKKMTREEYNDLLRKKGLLDPGNSSSTVF
jgi:hypothetical protein